MKEIHSIVAGPFAAKMPLWSLGYHLSRWGYGSAKKTFEVANELRAAGIPQEVQWNDIGKLIDYDS